LVCRKCRTWISDPLKRGGIKPPLHEENAASWRLHHLQIEGDSEASEEACGKLNLGCNAVLTISRGLLVLVSSLEATLLDRGVEQTLFDNLIDVPESVRPYSSPSSVNGDFE
jgi:hypothetical protein